MKILFRRVSYKNFLSTGNVPVEVDLTKSHMTLLSGKNGQGKSSLSDAITFALFGQAYRNLNKPGLINSINQKQCVVSLEFDIGKNSYRVVRGMKPNIFEIYENDKMLNQSPGTRDYQKILEQQIIKLNYRAFTQVIVMGSGSYVPFMKLNSKDRREFIEDLLDIRIFSVMNVLLKDKIKLTKQTMTDIDAEVKLLKEKIALQDSFVKRQTEERGANISKLEAELKDLNKEVSQATKKIASLTTALDSLEADATKFDVSEEMSELNINKRRLVKTAQEEQEQQTFYNEIDHCPTCQQSVSEEHKQHILNESQSKVDKINEELAQLEKSIASLNKKMSKYDDVSTKVSETNKELSQLNREVATKNALIQDKQEQIQKVKDTSSIQDDKEKLKSMAKSVLALDKNRKGVIEDGYYQSIMAQLLQDNGIKAKIIKQYVPVINKLINRYLDKLNFFVSFHLDENFNESVKSRHRDTFVYDNFSEGQKCRIDIALLFTWRELAKLKNSINTNLLFLDELFDGSTDQEGIDLAFSLLEDMKDTNIFVVSHRDGIQDKFSRVLTFEMKNNFTEVTE